jgi:hypothetical protein
MTNLAELVAGPQIDSEALYVRLARLIERMPDLANVTPTAEHQKWLGDAYALVEVSGDLMAPIELKMEIDNLGWGARNYTSTPLLAARSQNAALKIQTILYRIFAIVELKAPTAVQGSFIPAGNSFDAFAVIAQVLGKAKSDIFIVDPYLDEKILTDFAIAAPENVPMRLLSDEGDHKPTLKPAAKRWINQYGSKRPLELRFVPQRTVHDRLIVTDNSEVWILTQSFNAFATRAPASISRFAEPDMKIKAYDEMWKAATVASF